MRPFREEWADRWGAAASSICALHCAVCALLPAALGALGLGALLTHEAEWAFTLIAVAFGVMALGMGWRVHRSVGVSSLLVFGIVGLLISRGVEMGAGDHGHHEESHHAEGELHAEVTHDHPVHEDHSAHDEHGDHDDTMHLVGAGIGVMGGISLVLGHLLSIRRLRRCREECCE